MTTRTHRATLSLTGARSSKMRATISVIRWTLRTQPNTEILVVCATEAQANRVRHDLGELADRVQFQVGE